MLKGASEHPWAAHRSLRRIEANELYSYSLQAVLDSYEVQLKLTWLATSKNIRFSLAAVSLVR
jgi:hypothetical protein